MGARASCVDTIPPHTARFRGARSLGHTTVSKMAEEEKAQTPQPDDGNASSEDPPPTSAAGASAGAEAPSDTKTRRGDRDETPVEELFDLTKPLKKVDRPSKDAHEADLKVIEDAIDELRNRRQEVQDRIDEQIKGNSNSAASREREAASVLRARKSILINEKREIRARLNDTRDKMERLFGDQKAAKQNLKFTSLEDIEREIARLKHRQETTSMSLAEEKRLIKDMDALAASKTLVAQMTNKQGELDNYKEQRKQITAELQAKDKDIDAVQAEIDEKSALIKTLSEKETDFRGSLDKLFDERDAVRDEIKEKQVEKQTLKSDFRVKNNEWYTYQRAVRAKKKMEYEEERKRREEEKAAHLKKLEEEELKKIPYEEEQALCEYLAKHLTVTYLDPQNTESGEAASSKKDEVVPVSDDPFANFKPVKKKDDEVYLKMGSGKKMRERKSKKEKKKDKQAPFKLNIDTFDQFGLLGLVPPTSLEEVPKSVEDLRAKKEWYSQQPRGSVPTATEIRKQNQKAAQKVKTRGDGGGGTSSNGKKSGGFALSTDDFAPLGGGGGGGGGGAGSAVFNSSWGQKNAAPAPVDVGVPGNGDAGPDGVAGEGS